VCVCVCVCQLTSIFRVILKHLATGHNHVLKVAVMLLEVGWGIISTTVGLNKAIPQAV